MTVFFNGQSWGESNRLEAVNSALDGCSNAQKTNTLRKRVRNIDHIYIYIYNISPTSSKIVTHLAYVEKDVTCIAKFRATYRSGPLRFD